MSLDGFIAGPKGEYDWIIMDPAIDFNALFTEFDTLVMGRKTFEVIREGGPDGPTAGMKIYVVSRTLKPADYPEVTILSDGIIDAVKRLKAEAGKDIWLFGGGVLFRLLLDAGLVDTVELALMPILLGGGIPVLPAGGRSPQLHLESHRILPSGIVMLAYRINDGNTF